MIISHNMTSINTNRQLAINQDNASRSLEKLSSGFRINKAGDDAAGLAISEKMRGQIRGLDQSVRNAQDGISMIQTAEGSLSETHSILQRMKELATQSANDTNVTVDRGEIQKEMNQLTSEINRIGNTTEFNTQKLLKGKDVKVVATPETVAVNRAGVAGVPVGTTTDLTVNASSVKAIASNATVQGNTSAATGRVGATDQTTVSVKGQTASAVLSGLNFTSTVASSTAPNAGTIKIVQLAQATAGVATASTLVTTNAGTANAVTTFSIGTKADGTSDFTGTNRGELANYLKAIDPTAYAASKLVITVPEDPNANGPASAEQLIIPAAWNRSVPAIATDVYTGTLAGGVTEVQGVSTFSVASVIKEAGDTITVGGKTFTSVTSGAVAANGEFNYKAVSSYIVSGAAVSATCAVTAGAVATFTVGVGATNYVVSNADLVAYAGGAGKTNEDLITLLGNASNAGVKLSTVADISVGSDNKLQIVAKNATVTTNDITTFATSAVAGDLAAVNGLFGFSGATTVVNATTKAGALTGATVDDQARSLRVAINANTTLGTHYMATELVGTSGGIQMTEKISKADGTSLATVTTAGAGKNDGLNITDLSGKNLGQITISKGTGVAIAGANAKSTALDGTMVFTSGTKSIEMNGVKIAFAGLAAGATTTLTSTWDAANQTLNVTGSILTAETATAFVAALQTTLRTGLTAAGFKGGAAFTAVTGASATAATIMTQLNGKSTTMGPGSTALNSNVINTTMQVSAAAASANNNPLDGVRISFTGLTDGGAAGALTSSWDAANKTLTVTGTLASAGAAAAVAAALQAAVSAGLATALGTTATTGLTISGGAAVATAALAALNGNSLLLSNGGGIATVAAHAMVVDQKNGDLNIVLSDNTFNSNTAAKIQTAVQALGTVQTSTGTVDYSKYQFTADPNGDWDTKSLGENITKANATLVGGTVEVKGDYSFDITKAFAVGDKVSIKGQIFTAVKSGAIGSRNEFDVSNGDINNQAASLRNAIGLNSALNATYIASGTGATIKMTEIDATGTDLSKTDLAVKGTGIAGQYSINTSKLLENGAAFVVDGKEITVSNKNAHVGYGNGTAIKVAADGATQTAELVAAINKNADLKDKYTASVGTDGSLILTQKELHESATAPAVATKNSSIGEFTAALQIGANAGQSMTINVADMRANAIGVSGDGSVSTIQGKDGKVASYVAIASVTNGTDNKSVEFALDVSDHDKATNAISVIQDAIEAVSAERSKMGAFQNRLDHTIANLGTSSENMTAAESRIRDVDMAKEMMNFQKNNILQQAATAMMAQANQLPQGVLQLLR